MAQLRPGELHRVLSEHAQAGGKGINVARTLRALGHRVQLVVVVGGENGQWILRDLELAGLRVSVVHAPGESRTCLEIVDEDGAATQLHGSGVDARGAVGEHLVHVVAELVADARWLALCGSLAPGMPADTAAEIVEVAHAAGARAAVDLSGAALSAAVRRGADLVRVNREEAEASGCGPSQGGAWIVSDGEGRIRAWDGTGGSFVATPPQVRLRNPIGCGDAMMAGLLAGLDDATTFRPALRTAIALGAAQAEAPWAGSVDLARARALEAVVRMEDAPD